MVRNTYIYPPEPSMRIIGDIIEYTAKNMPKFNSISISGYHMQEAGANQALELAFTLADGKEYVKTAIAKGMDVDDFAGRLSSSGRWHELLPGSRQDARRAPAVVPHHEGLQRQEPQEPDAAHALPDQRLEPDRAGPLQQRGAHHHRGHGGGVWRHAEPAHQQLRRSHCAAHRVQRRIARNTQLIIQEETHITNVVDPWAGSYMMEKLTQDMADAAWKPSSKKSKPWAA
jgi:methylmalonyl-CoA mutase